MAFLQQCKTCNANVSSEAKFCPHCGQPDPTCFPGDARVLTPRGYRRIDSIVPGDIVVSWSMSSRTQVPRYVSKLLTHPSSRIWTVEFASRRPPIRTTGFHTILTARGWERVDKLTTGDRLIETCPAVDLGPRIVRTCETSEIVPVYNLVTTGEHNFIVEGVVAHNFTFLRNLRTLTYQLLFDPGVRAATPVYGTSDSARLRTSPAVLFTA